MSLVPGLIDFSAYAEDAHVISLLVARLDEAAFRQHFRERSREGSRRGKKRYLKHFADICEIQDYLLSQAEQHEVPIVDNLSVESSVLLVMRHVAETLRRECDVAQLRAAAK